MSYIMSYVIVFAVIIGGIAIAFFIGNYKHKKKILTEIEAAWGKTPDREYKPDDLKYIKAYFDNIKLNGNKIHTIDDITWNDLEMDKVYMRLNNCISTVGEEYLYALLREPLFEEDKLKERDRLIDFFEHHSEERKQLQLALGFLGKAKGVSVSDIFFSDMKSSGNSSKYKLQAIGLLLSPLIAFLVPAVGVLMLLGLIFLNIKTYYTAKNDEESRIETIRYVVSLVSAARKASLVNIPEAESFSASLADSYEKLKKVISKASYVIYQIQDPFMFFELIKVLFLVEPIAFEGIMSSLAKNKGSLKVLYENIGYLDSVLSIASYRQSIKKHTKPVLVKNSQGKPLQLKFKEIYHPLIKNPVKNSLETAKPVLITGSNASGKSTFIKTVALHAIFAQTIYTCLATEYTSNYFKIYTSMALRDNIFNNESYYIAEIKSLKRILDDLESDHPILCMIDEVLRGTNTVERIAASSQILKHFAQSNCICFAATHDIELTSVLGRFFNNYHFQESFVDNEITFDYKLYPGKSNSRNAIKLLKYLGYEDVLVDEAENRALSFIEDGIWHEV